MNLYFIMDPLETVQVKKDTTFAFIEEATTRGHHTHYVPTNGLSVQNGEIILNAQRITPTRNAPTPFQRHETNATPATTADAIFIRTEPPFDANYLETTWLLDHIKKQTLILNDPTAIRSTNEKLWTLQFPHLIPRTSVLRHTADLKAFLKQEQKIIVKPTDGFGGKGIFLIQHNDPNASVIFETLTENNTRSIIAQQHIPEASIGDKRILLLNGQPLGAVLRVHGKHDHRNNFFAGGSAQKAQLTPRDLEICDTLKPHLQNAGLHFTGIDIIGNYLIEVNVTSPTCIQEMSALNNTNYSAKVINYVESLCNS